MQVLLKILKWTFISVVGIVGLLVLTFFVYDSFFYEREMNQIREQLNEIENVEVVNIWGHKDITLEEISARIRIKNKGEVVLYGLSKDAFHYPDRVPLLEIGGYSFTHFSCNGGIGPGIDIANKNELGRIINVEFNSVEEVTKNYDLIIETVKNLKVAPEINHFETRDSESYILVSNENTSDQDPIFNLIGIENMFEFAETLEWNNNDCYYNKKKNKK